MMSDLDRLRGHALPSIPLAIQFRASLLGRLGGAPLHQLVIEANVFDDPRDLLEWLHIQLIRASLRPGSDRLMTSLVHAIRHLRWQLRLSGNSEDHFRPGIEFALKTELSRLGSGFTDDALSRDG